MADSKNIITLGIGASPGSIEFFILSGLEAYLAPDISAGFAMHARSTDTLYHAYETAGEKNTALTLAYLTDQDGNKLTDQSGNYLVANGRVGVVVLHAQPTSTIYHAEA